MNPILRAFIVVIIVAAVIRGVGLARFAADQPPSSLWDGLLPRELLGLPGDHRVRRMVATPMPSGGAAVLWVDDDGAATAIMPDSNGRLRIGRGLRAIGDRNIDGWNTDTLVGLDHTDWPALPPRLARLSVHRWDESAPVYVTVGADGKPGIAGIDDDGDGVIDDLGELGATGSDDRVVAPQQPGYRAAAAGEIVSRVISRGALVAIESDLLLPPPRADDSDSEGSEVWLEFAGSASVEPIRLCLQVH